MNIGYVPAVLGVLLVVAAAVGYVVASSASHQPAAVEVSASPVDWEADCYMHVYVDALNDDDRVILEQPFAETATEQFFRTSPILRSSQYGDFENGQGKALTATVDHGDRIRVYSVAFDDDRVTMHVDSVVSEECTLP